MKTIQLTLDDDLLDRVNRALAQQQTSLTLFIKESLIHYLHKLKVKELEKQHREGYSKRPIEKGEFDVLEDEQISINFYKKISTQPPAMTTSTTRAEAVKGKYAYVPTSSVRFAQRKQEEIDIMGSIR